MATNVLRPRGIDRVRYLAAAAAAAAAVLYLLIGAGVLSVGTAASGEATDLFSFGAMAGGTFAIVAALLLRFRSRPLWVAVGALQVVVIVGYFAVADVRTPPIEPWGLLIKASQAVVLLAVIALAIRGRREPAA